jgi:hypothetical protein
MQEPLQQLGDTPLPLQWRGFSGSLPSDLRGVRTTTQRKAGILCTDRVAE